MSQEKQEKILFMGCSFGTLDALLYAKSLGIYTIITDNLSVEEQPLKTQADEFWMIDVKNLDELQKACQKAGITGIFGGTSEFCLDKTKELCERLNFPFYASNEGWASSRDKERFKRHCIECGIDVPRQYEMTENGNFPDDISWPVIVKPVDSCAQIGISICRNKNELKSGYLYAKKYSVSGRVIVEDYLQGDEIAAFYIVENGCLKLTELTDVVHTTINNQSNFIYVGFQSKYLDEYNECIESKVANLCEKMKCKNGVLYFQMIHKNGKFYFFEMGYRLNAVPTWITEEKLFGLNIVRYMVECSLGHKIEQQFVFHNTENANFGGIYFVWSSPGKIAAIEGVSKVAEEEGIDVADQRFSVGDIVPTETSMLQIAFRISIVAKNKTELQAKVRLINQYLHMYSIDGKEMLYYFDDHKVY